MANRVTRIVLAFALALAGVPAAAATIEDLDALSRVTEQADSGIAFARSRIAEGDLLEALAALERVILNHPDSSEARLLHASLMCRLDDRRGALPEFEGLRGHDLPGAAVEAARRPCTVPGGG